jgi:hypothetical protein
VTLAMLSSPDSLLNAVLVWVSFIHHSVFRRRFTHIFSANSPQWHRNRMQDTQEKVVKLPAMN